MSKEKRAIAMGFFDGIHVGHAALLNRTKQRAAEIGAIPSVLSFDNHPDELIFGRKVPLLTDCVGREEIIKRCFGIDNVYFIHFSPFVMNMPWQNFIENIVAEQKISYFIVGHDFTFGAHGEGTAERLKQYSEEKGIGCDIIPAVMLDGRIVSSTYIRSLVEAGDMKQAARYLGHPHCLSDTVHQGYHIGRKMEAPTVNMFFPEGVIVPRNGVYATKVTLEDGAVYHAVTNVGVRPTFEGNGTVSVESHLLDFSGNLYGSKARVDFYDFVRPEKVFENADELSRQIKKDISSVRVLFNEKR